MFNLLYDHDSQTTCTGTLIEHDLMPILRQGWNRRMIRQEVRLLVCYTEYIGSYLLTFRDNVSVPPSRIFLTTNLRQAISQKSADLVYTATEA